MFGEFNFWILNLKKLWAHRFLDFSFNYLCTMLIDLIAGARPNFMKIAPIIDAIKAAQKEGKRSNPTVFRIRPY